MRISAPKRRACTRCGVPRAVMIKGQLQLPDIAYSLRWLCIPCLGNVLGFKLTKDSNKDFMETWEAEK